MKEIWFVAGFITTIFGVLMTENIIDKSKSKNSKTV